MAEEVPAQEEVVQGEGEQVGDRGEVAEAEEEVGAGVDSTIKTSWI